MRNIFYSLTGIMLLLGITACSEEERYATSVVKEIQLFLDDEPWAVNTGASNKPLFIYTADGEYVANYSSLYRFQLPNGSYNIISTTQSDSIDYLIQCGSPIPFVYTSEFLSVIVKSLHHGTGTG
jgi:hypothetical protein